VPTVPGVEEMIYLASPYISPDQLVRLGRFNHVWGKIVFSPIAHCFWVVTRNGKCDPGARR